MWKWILSKMMRRGWKSFEVHAVKSLYCIERTVGRTMDIKSASSEVSEREGTYYWKLEERRYLS